MDCVSDELLPGPGLSLNEYGGIRRSNTLRLFQNDSQRRTVAYDLLESAGPTILISHCHRFDSQSPPAFTN